MFIGRKAELQFLEDKYRQKDGQLIVLVADVLEKRRHFGSSVKENRISFFPAENAQIKCS